jgi:hypothetical protein
MEMLTDNRQKAPGNLSFEQDRSRFAQSTYSNVKGGGWGKREGGLVIERNIPAVAAAAVGREGKKEK